MLEAEGYISESATFFYYTLIVDIPLIETSACEYEPYRNDSDHSDQDGETENTPLNRQNDTSW